MGRRSDTSRLWTGILLLAVAVAALFVLDPFSSSGDRSDEDQGPIVAILARDEDVEVPEVTPELDEVLGRAVVPAEHTTVEPSRTGDSTDSADPVEVPATEPTGTPMSVIERGLRRLDD